MLGFVLPALNTVFISPLIFAEGKKKKKEPDFPYLFLWMPTDPEECRVIYTTGRTISKIHPEPQRCGL